MTTLSDLTDAHSWIGTRWSSNPPPGEASILELARDVLDFIFATGQRYRFEDASSLPLEAPASSQQGSAGLREADRFFDRLLGEPGSAVGKAPIRAILDAIRFVAMTGQYEALEAYRKHVQSHAPPFVVAAFGSMKEAETWLENHPHPPDPARILIADRSHDVVHDRETDSRRLPPNRDLQDYLVELQRLEPPVAVASFATREEATAWLRRQPEPLGRQWLSIAGEIYLAASYPHIGYRALFPLSIAEGHKG